jgi:hypothetical protein
MRRRRQGLQVQTFPFLAVLLCTMGALILLLLVIDRRAKAAARAHALQAAQETVRKQSEAEVKAAAAHREELERKRLELHALLAGQEQDLRQKIKAVEAQAAAAAGKLEEDQANYAALLRRLQDEQGLLAKDRQDLASRQAALQEAAGMKDSAKREVARLASELANLEEALASLKALRGRERQTYSVVPYLGRRGANRRPLYVECAAEGVIFHPDRQALGGDVSAQAVRQEVERRLAGQRKTAGSETAPYLLLLVRPGGIATYYLMKTALAGLALDYGYELIDQDWLLDLSEGGQLAQASPRQDEGQRKAPSPLAALQPPAPPGGSAGSWSRQGSQIGGTSAGATNGGGGAAVLGPPGTAGAAAGPGWRQASAPAGAALLGAHSGREADGSHAQGPSGVPVGRGVKVALGPSLAGALGGSDGGLPGSTAGLGAPVGRGPDSPGAAVPAFGADSGGSPGAPRIGFTAAAYPLAQHGDGAGGLGPATGAQPATAGAGGSVALQAGASQGIGLSTPALGPGGAGAAGLPSGVNLAPGQGGAAGSATVPGPAPTPGAGQPGSGPPAGQPGLPAEGSAGGGAAAGSSVSGGPAPLIPGPPTAGQAPSTVGGTAGQGEPAAPGTSPGVVSLLPGPRGAPRGPVPLGRLIASRDWIIAVECRADGVTVLSTGQHYPLDALRASASGVNPLAATVRQLIDRRQATVRVGEAPYRPILRFRVYADGLRAYYTANGLLEVLRLPTTRESVEPERRAVPDLFRP